MEGTFDHHILTECQEDDHSPASSHGCHSNLNPQTSPLLFVCRLAAESAAEKRYLDDLRSSAETLESARRKPSASSAKKPRPRTRRRPEN
jgi:hypothetical protein